MNKKIAHVGAIVVGVLTPVATLVTAEIGALPTNWRDTAAAGVAVLGSSIVGVKAFDSYLETDQSAPVVVTGMSDAPTHPA
jgi:hypothetical protein